MFYSHSILAKKSALGTVWIAAHLATKLRKSHVAVTDISYSVEQIMFPSAPIALRLSGHLLLGVVRIYSRKVDYLYDDWKEFEAQIRMLFKPVNVNLPEDANCATFQSVTLPDTFELDALELDDPSSFSAGHDKHFKTLEEITLPEQIPVDGGLYISIVPNEDYTQSTPQSEGQSAAVTQMEEDVLPPFPMDVGEEINTGPRDGSGGNAREPSPSVQLQRATLNNLGDDFADASHEVEVMRDAVQNLGPDSLPESGDRGADSSFHQGNRDDLTIRKEGLPPNKEHLSVSGVESLPPPSPQNAPIVASVEIPNVGLSLGQSIPGLALQPSLPANRRGARNKRRNPLFDDNIVLSNAEMKTQIKGRSMSKYKRRRREPSECILDATKPKLRCWNERIFEMPLLSGMCERLKKTCDIRIVSVLLEPPAGMDAQSFDKQPQPDGAIDQNSLDAMETVSKQLPVEQPQSVCGNNQDIQDVLGVKEQTPVEQPQLDDGTCQIHRDIIGSIGEQPPIEQARLDGGFDQDKRDIIGGMSGQSSLEQPQFGVNSGGHSRLPSSLLETPIGNLEERLGDADILERTSPPDFSNVDDLFFLEADSTPSSPETSRSSSMSVRTRAVAQYLKGHSPGSHMPTSHLGDLCLNSILEGRTRKQCARMFFEALVLKSYDIIDVQQREPYGDITVSLTPMLSKMQF